jgi:DNA-binding protein HU-beta
MNKTELVSYIAEKYQTTKTEGEGFVNKFVDLIEDVLAKGESIHLVGFGSFSVKEVKAREGRNPRTGKPLHIKAYNQVLFRSGKTLKDKVNNQ